MQLSGPMVCQSKHCNPVCGLAVVKVILPNGFPIEQLSALGCLKFVRRNEPTALLTLATFGFSPRVALVLGQIGI